MISVPLRPTPAWMSQANCQGTDTNEFYPDKGGDSTAARRICRRCPVRLECLKDALDRREKHGIWGGLSDHQRTALLRRRERQQAREAAATKQQEQAGNTCVTCDEPEDRWDTRDRLYISGGVKCPGCSRADLDEEKTLEHTEMAA
ncbi:hypothetical protein DKT68_08515 [Micromonospora acroterricola]|uniref:Transcriptional regulator WhiB n=1 Tax=Micromonospora acroterricola TaxID=2202421 RepID=A0A317D8I8_9ACTN|nr:WhiB family transcriptional regulator [Micromonospora acroterricola]PWR10592.1 hypothetical protein DKT68_08515 [Micromonospora acroterricola]